MNLIPDTVVPIYPIFVIAIVSILGMLWFLVIKPLFSKSTKKQKNTNNKKTIFISYRRDETGELVGRIHDRLYSRFGEAVFKDVHSIPIGVNFSDHIHETLQSVKVFILVIGKDWSTYFDKRDLDDDFVLIETIIALERYRKKGLFLVPVLVQNSEMPSQNSLPEVIRDITRLNGAKLRNDPDFDSDISKIVDTIEANLTYES